MLLGRTDDLTRLREAALPAHPVSTAVFLDGAIGVGKTALLTALLAEPGLPRVLFARPAETPSHIPFDGIRGVLEDLLDEDLPALLATGATARTIRRRVREALTDGPTLVVIDDAHWLDRDALDLLADLMSEPLPGTVSFLFAHRSTLVPDPLPHAAARGGLVVSRLSLAPLDDETARTLLVRLGIEDPEILRLAKGNPLFLRLLAEGARDLGDGGDPAALADAALGGMDDTLRAEIAALPAGPRRLLHAMSLAPAPAPADLAALADLDHDAFLAASDRLAAQGLTDPVRLEILHPLVRAAASRDMDAATRRRMRRAAAGRADGLLDRAAHLRHLGAHLSADELSTLMEAAELILVTAPRNSLALLEGSRRIPHRRRDLLLARALLLDGRPREAEQLLRDLATAPDDDAAEASALLIQALRVLGRPDEAVELVRELGRTAADHPAIAVEAATLEVMHGGALTFLSDDDAERYADDLPGVAAALSSLVSLARLRAGDLEGARIPYARARDGFLTLPAGDLVPVLDAITAAGWSAHVVADFAGGAAMLERALLLAERHGRFHALPHLYLILAFLYIPLDRCDEAEELIEQAIDAADRYDWPDVAPLAATAALVAGAGRVPPEEMQARLTRLLTLDPPRTGLWREVVEVFRARAGVRVGATTDPAVFAVTEGDVFGPQKHIGLGELALARGDGEAALGHAADAIAIGERHDLPSQIGHGLLLRTEALLALGRPAEALDHARIAAARFAEAGTPLYARLAQGWVARLEAAVPPAPPEPPASAAADGIPADAVTATCGPPLTAREHDIAELVADGLSNREIAGQLHLSVRTVESHVARILRKHDLRSRAGIARFLLTCPGAARPPARPGDANRSA